MPILVSNLRVPFGRAPGGAPEDDAIWLAQKRLGIPAGRIRTGCIYKKSLDVRKGREPAFVFSVLLSLAQGEAEAVRCAAGPIGATGPIGPTGPTGATAPIIYAQLRKPA